MLETKNKIKFFFFLIITVGLVFVSGFFIGKSQVTCDYCEPSDIDFSLFWEAYEKLKDNYVDSSQFDIQKMVYGAISGMVNSIGDPYTVFLSPEKSKKFLEDVSGRFEGIGVEVSIRENNLQVISPLEGTPAQKAGLRAGDKILKIDDIFTIDLTIDDAIDLIRGPKGTEVILTIFRNEWEDIKEIKIIRGIIEIPSLSWELIEIDGKKEIAYIKIYQFSEKTSSDFQKKSLEIINSSAKSIILDLRNNPGGYLETSQDIAGWFLKKGETVVIEDFGDTKEQKFYRAEGNARLLQYPLVVLINQGTASAAEILAGALRDNREVKLIGEKSFGKGSIQGLERLKGNSILKITIAKWLTPNGELITDKGLEPDIMLEITEDNYNEEFDIQLEKAVEEIKKII